MSVRVNLLPKESADRERASRARAGVAVGALVLVGALAGVYLWELGRVSDAQQVVDDEQTELAALRAELGELDEYRELAARRDASGEIIAFALGGEASMAGLLQDLASVFPPDTELDTFTVDLTGDEEAAFGDIRPAEGTMTMTGRTLRGHAPGVERLMLELDKMAAIGDLFFSNSTVEEETGDILFTVEADLGPEIYTQRYLSGLPEVLR